MATPGIGYKSTATSHCGYPCSNYGLHGHRHHNQGCTATATVTVTVSPTPTLTLSPGNKVTSCLGDTVQLTASGGNTYQWQPQSLTTNPQSSTTKTAPTQTTVFTITATNTTGCTTTDTIRVDVSTVDVTINGPTKVCANTIATITVSGANSYQWQPGGQSGNTITPTIDNATTFTVTGTGPSGCTDTAIDHDNTIRYD